MTFALIRRWNYSEFSPCMSPCGIGIQTRDVTCIHEVTRGSTGKAVPVPNQMCPQPPPTDRRYCNVWDCPVKWSIGEWGKVLPLCARRNKPVRSAQSIYVQIIAVHLSFTYRETLSIYFIVLCQFRASFPYHHNSIPSLLFCTQFYQTPP